MSTSSPRTCWNRSRDEVKLVRKAVITLELLRDQQQDADRAEEGMQSTHYKSWLLTNINYFYYLCKLSTKS